MYGVNRLRMLRWWRQHGNLLHVNVGIKPEMCVVRQKQVHWSDFSNHGAIASNAFISVLNPAVANKCPFCDLHETVFYRVQETH